MSEEYKNGSIIHDDNIESKSNITLYDIQNDMIELFDRTNKRIDKILRIVFEITGGIILFGLGILVAKLI